MVVVEEATVVVGVITVVVGVITVVVGDTTVVVGDTTVVVVEATIMAGDAAVTVDDATVMADDGTVMVDDAAVVVEDAAVMALLVVEDMLGGNVFIVGDIPFAVVGDILFVIVGDNFHYCGGLFCHIWDIFFVVIVEHNIAVNFVPGLRKCPIFVRPGNEASAKRIIGVSLGKTRYSPWTLELFTAPPHSAVLYP